MGGRSNTLSVDYYTQPTSNTCQSTVLKMMASYLEGTDGFTSGQAASLNPVDIYHTINHDPGRPDKSAHNSHKNMIWWLQNRFPNLKFKEITTHDEGKAIDTVVGRIDNDSPVLVSVSHARVPGHFIIVIGYVNYQPNASSPDFGFVVHDPYGKFDPSLLSKLYGKQRFTGGSSLVTGGEIGPGKSVILPVSGIGRQRLGDGARGTYILIYVDK